MKVLDTNVILRYFLHDNDVMYAQAAAAIETASCTVFPEVVAEVVYVLSSVYKMPRDDVSETVIALLDDVDCERKDAVQSALHLFSITRLDFVDCLLIAYHRQYGWDVLTFDKKMAHQMTVM